MNKWKNVLTLVGVGVVIGAVIVLLLISIGARPNKITVGIIEFELPTAMPMPSPQIRIDEPKEGAIVTRDQTVRGIITNPPDDVAVWIFTGQIMAGEAQPRYWVQRGSPGSLARAATTSVLTWSGTAFFADSDVGKDFKLTAVVADTSINLYLQGYIASVDKGNVFPFIGFPPFKAFLAGNTVNVTRH